MRLRISDMAEVIDALTSGVHPNRIAARLTYPVLPPIPLGHYLNSIDGVMFPLKWAERRTSSRLPVH